MTKKPPSSFSGNRQLKQRVKTAKRRKISSVRWLARQINDPYVHLSKKEGYRSRAAYKILELDDQFKFFKPGKVVIDLGAAPGGWTQVAVKRVKSTPENIIVVGLDLLSIPAIEGSELLVMDFMDEKAPDAMRALTPGGADIVLSDMAPNTTGHSVTDHLRIMGLLESAHEFACEVLKPGGVFIAKVFQGGTEQTLLADMKKRFTTVKHAKPKASRADSSEFYVVALGFRGDKA